MGEPVRIAQIAGKMNGGGVEAVIMNYYRHIDRNEVQFDFIVDADSTLVPLEEIQSMGGRVIRIPPYQRPIAYQLVLTNVLRENHYPIVQSHLSTMSFFSLMAANRAGTPIRISHCHTTNGNDGWKRRTLKQLLRIVSRVYPTDFFACSEYAGKWLFGARLVKAGRLRLCPNAIDLNSFRYSPWIRAKKRRELGIDHNYVVGHIGRFVGPKNHSFLIDIFSEIKKKESTAVLLLVGTGPLAGSVRQKVAALECEDSVLFLGQRRDVSELYQAMDVFLLPSLYEGLPVVGVEAQAAGLPCIFSQNITEEARLLDTTKMIGLEREAQVWAEETLLMRQNKRTDTVSILREKGFDIFEQGKRLGRLYKDLLENETTKVN